MALVWKHRKAVCYGVLAQIAVTSLSLRVEAQSSGVRLDPIAEIRPLEDSEASLGNVTGIVVKRDGSVFVAEQSPARIAEYTTNGKLRRVIAREGEGPGEVRMPELALLHDTLVVFDPPAARVSWINPSGEVLRSVLVPVTMQGGEVWTTRAGAVLLQANFVLPDRSRNALRINPSGAIDTIRWKPNLTNDLALNWRGPGWAIRGHTPFAPSGVATFDPLGRLIVGGTRESRWAILLGMDTVGVVVLPTETPQIKPAIRDSVWEAWYGRLPKTLPQLDDVVKKSRFPTLLPPWVSMDVDAGGLWWIGRPSETGVLARWDIVELGNIIGTVAVPAPLVERRNQGPLIAYGQNTVAMLHESSAGLPWLGVYRVRRSDP